MKRLRKKASEPQKITKPLPQTQNDEAGKLSIAQCKEILCREGAKYSDEEVSLVRKVLYALAEVDYDYHCKLLSKQSSNRDTTSTTTIPLHTTPININAQQESHSLRPGIHRRTG
jgi:hypothetical protein